MKKDGYGLPIVTGGIAVLALVAGLTLPMLAPPEIVPERAETPVPTLAPPSPSRSSPPTSASTIAAPQPEPTKSAQPIKASGITTVEIPAVKIKVKASGEDWPRKSERCHGGDTCIDPPSLTKVVWYGAYSLPSIPSTGSVLVFGHTNQINKRLQAFNNLGAVEDNDKVVITTKTGRFTYRAQKAFFVPYEKVSTSKKIFENIPDRAVFVTCGGAKGAIVVLADLVSAKPR